MAVVHSKLARSATLLPLFETFYSGVSTTVLETEPNFEEPTVLDNVLTLPLSNGLEVTAPDLLSLGEGMWADTLLLIGGAMSSDRRFIRWELLQEQIRMATTRWQMER